MLATEELPKCSTCHAHQPKREEVLCRVERSGSKIFRKIHQAARENHGSPVQNSFDLAGLRKGDLETLLTNLRAQTKQGVKIRPLLVMLISRTDNEIGECSVIKKELFKFSPNQSKRIKHH